ncbi:MAG: response regulator transcription factor [Saprospiraceae bacterium]|nr:response regulator transcription factor [Saprospiraceae bacterium]
MRAAILDDEPHNVQLLAHLLTQFFPEIVEIRPYTDSVEAVEALQANPPDLLLLDIEMPQLNGFDVLNRLLPLRFRVIFVTAYDKYAVRAFRYSALDYLLKPIDVEEFRKAVQKALSQKPPLDTQFELLRDVQQQSLAIPDRLAISSQDGLLIIDTNEIIHCESESNYSKIFMRSGQKIVVSRTLKDLEELLDQEVFFRLHHSHLVNLRSIRRYLRGEGGEVVLENNTQLPVARSKKEEFLRRFARI